MPPGALTSMIEIFLCGSMQGRKSPGLEPRGDVRAKREGGDVDDRSLAVGTNVCVWDPQAVWIMSRNCGAAGFVTSKTRTPSYPTRPPSTSGALTLEQSSAVWAVSTDWNRKVFSPILWNETSPCGPLQTRSTTVWGWSPVMSRIRKPVKLPAYARLPLNARSVFTVPSFVRVAHERHAGCSGGHGGSVGREPRAALVGVARGCRSQSERDRRSGKQRELAHVLLRWFLGDPVQRRPVDQGLVEGFEVPPGSIGASRIRSFRARERS